MSFTVDGTSGLTFPNATTQASANGMTLLGTITVTAANSVSLGSLTLTNYKALFVVLTSVAGSGVDNFYMSSTNVASGIYFYPSNAASGMVWVDLATGTGGGGYAYGSGGTYGAGGTTSISTATTTIYFRFPGVLTFTGTGSIKIYGVA
jgi:hypothetical protein